MSTKQTIITEYQSSFLRTQRMARESVRGHVKTYWEHLPDLPIPAYQGVSVFQDMWLTYPYDRDLIKHITQRFLDAGWEKSWEITESEVKGTDDNPRISFGLRSKDIFLTRIICEFDTTKEGSTCVKKKIGTTTKEVDVVEFVCSEADD